MVLEQLFGQRTDYKMALTNLFENIATEDTAGSIDRNTGIISRAGQSPKNASFVPRVVVDNTLGVYNYRTYMWDTGTYVGWWNGVAAFTVDQRQTLTEQTRTNAISCRTRWST